MHSLTHPGAVHSLKHPQMRGAVHPVGRLEGEVNAVSPTLDRHIMMMWHHVMSSNTAPKQTGGLG